MAVLPRGARVEAPARSARADVIVAGHPLEVAWAARGSLGDVRALLDRRGSHLPDVVAAPVLSPGARQLLSDTGVGWVDETGAAEIAVGTIIVSKSGRPPTSRPRPLAWSRAVVAVAEAMLCGAEGTVAGVRDASGLSAGSCSHALRVLTDLGLLEADAARGPHSARRIRDETDLLHAYAAAAPTLAPKPRLQVGVTWQDPLAGLTELGRRWDDAGVGWAATGVAAAAVLAPHLGNVTSTEVFVDADTVATLEAVAEDAGLRVLQGGRLTLRPFPTSATRRRTERVGGLRVAPWPRVYADLLTVGVRGEEAGEHLRELMRA